MQSCLDKEFPGQEFVWMKSCKDAEFSGLRVTEKTLDGEMLDKEVPGFNQGS